MKPRKWKEVGFYLGANLVGSVLYGVGILCFTTPHHIAPGGAGGIAALVHYFTGVPIGLFLFLFTVPLLLIGGRYLGKSLVLKTLFSAVLLFVVMDYVVVWIPVYEGDPLLASMFGGALMGIGLAVMYAGGVSTGGMPLLGLILQKVFPNFQMGGLLTVLNIGVVITSAFGYRDINSLLYAVICVYISGIVMNNGIGGLGEKRLMIVISEYSRQIREILVSKRNGVTLLRGEGGYSKEARQVIMSAVFKKDCELLQEQIKEIDSNALVVVTQASKESGKGFRHVI